MIRAKAANGWFLFGFTEAELKQLLEAPVKVDLTANGGKDTVIIFAGTDRAEVMKFLEDINEGPLPALEKVKA